MLRLNACRVFCRAILFTGNPPPRHPIFAAYQGVYDFRPCDKIVDWAIDKGMEVKGHTLCWHVTTPEFAEEMSASRLREALYRREREMHGRRVGWEYQYCQGEQ